MADAIGMRRDGEDEFRERSKVTGDGGNRAREKSNDNDGTGSPEWSSGDGKKQRAKKEEQRRLQSFIGRPRKRKEATPESFPCQRNAQTTTRAIGSKPKDRRQCSKSGEHCTSKLQNCHLV